MSLIRKTYPLHVLFEDSEESKYLFVTDSGIEYLVTFSRATQYFIQICEACQRIYDFNFFPNGSNKGKGRDPLIEYTIVQTLKYFINEYKSPVLFICDSSDRRQICRAKLFQRWYNNENNREIQLMTRELIYQDYTVIMGIIALENDEDIELYFNEIDHSVFE